VRPVTNVIFDLGGVVLRWDPDEILRNFYADGALRSLAKRELFQHADWLFDHIARRFDLAPQHTVFIDDLLANIESGGRLGFNTILFENAAQCRQALRERFDLPRRHG
jgi:FMN phosphatase YigB (HAD superfamily)